MKPTEEIFIVSLSEARAKKLPWYFTGKPCCHGHISKRTTVNQTCTECMNEKARLKRLRNPEQAKKADKKRYYENLDKKREGLRKSRLKNLEKRREYDLDRYQNQQRKDWQKLQAKNWALTNPGKRREITKSNKMRLKSAMPKWLTNDMKKQIKDIYSIAGELGPEFHVDHIHPINGRNLCGLHVPWNLQILPAIDNIKKGNRYVAD